MRPSTVRTRCSNTTSSGRSRLSIPKSPKPWPQPKPQPVPEPPTVPLPNPKPTPPIPPAADGSLMRAEGTSEQTMRLADKTQNLKQVTRDELKAKLERKGQMALVEALSLEPARCCGRTMRIGSHSSQPAPRCMRRWKPTKLSRNGILVRVIDSSASSRSTLQY
jgi:hypothetical protein